MGLEVNIENERIVCPAVYYDDGIKRPMQPSTIETGIVVCGFRHPSCVIILEEKFGLDINSDIRLGISSIVQGFLTTANRFVDRREATIIALESGQVKKLKYGDDGELYSEDLY